MLQNYFCLLQLFFFWSRGMWNLSSLGPREGLRGSSGSEVAMEWMGIPTALRTPCEVLCKPPKNSNFHPLSVCANLNLYYNWTGNLQVSKSWPLLNLVLATRVTQVRAVPLLINSWNVDPLPFWLWNHHLFIKHGVAFSFFHFFFFNSISVLYCIWPQAVGSSSYSCSWAIWICLKALLPVYVTESGCQINKILFSLVSTVVL